MNSLDLLHLITSDRRHRFETILDVFRKISAVRSVLLLKLFCDFGFRRGGGHSTLLLAGAIIDAMIMFRDRSHGSVQQDRQDHWLAQASFGLFVAGLMVCLVALYLGGPVDF